MFKRNSIRIVVWAIGLLLAGAATAQRYAAPHAELPTAEQPARNVPIRSYTLALSWAPEYCHAARGQRAADPECRDPRARSGFTLHGLWPDGDGPDRWPQYCRPVAILTAAQVKAGVAYTPSPQLLQHEWAKHGSCMGDDPIRYFVEEGRLFRSVALPDMARLARRGGTTAGDLQRAFADANPAIPATAVRVTANRRGWLDEVWLCLDRGRRFTACDGDQGGGAASDAPLRIQLPERVAARRSYRRPRATSGR